MSYQKYKHPKTGEILMAREWAIKIGISKNAFLKRIQRHGSDASITYALPNTVKHGKALARFNRGRKKNCHINIDLSDMQPRKSRSELTPVGSWEKKYLHPDSFHTNGPGEGAVEHGKDHYMGRTY